MYDAVADDSCDPGTTVLKNKLDLTDADELDAFEAEVSDARADEALPAGDLDFIGDPRPSVPGRLRLGLGNSNYSSMVRAVTYRAESASPVA